MTGRQAGDGAAPRKRRDGRWTRAVKPLLRVKAMHLRGEDNRAYLARGRYLGRLTRERLDDAYLFAGTMVCVRGRLDASWALWDVGAEYRLRDLPAPTHLLAPLLPALTQRVAQAFVDPATHREVKEMIAAFIADLGTRLEG
ncbi:MAG: hypothetical protein KIT25_22955 [Enhydrobacter sp.]|nr:MAG: hypothetical protein KIT25_22955 [Enhydrobacter sp.]